MLALSTLSQMHEDPQVTNYYDGPKARMRVGLVIAIEPMGLKQVLIFVLFTRAFPHLDNLKFPDL